MRLLLDEHHSPAIAEQLVTRGRDATTVQAVELLGVSDEELLIAGADDGRAILTNNAADFVPLARRWAEEGRTHAGVVLTADSSMPRSKDAIGTYVGALSALFDQHPDDVALRGQVRWLDARLQSK